MLFHDSCMQTETAQLLKAVESRVPSVEKARADIATESAAVDAEEKRLNAIREECAAELSIALPVLEASLAALDTITPADLTTVKSMQQVRRMNWARELTGLRFRARIRVDETWLCCVLFHTVS